MTFWHKLQRRWPYVRIEPPLKESPGWDWVTADVPDVSGARYGIKVDIDGMRQGSYQSQPACFMKLSIANGTLTPSAEICYMFRLCPASQTSQTGTKKELDDKPCALIAAYGPAHITSTATQARAAESDLVRPASIIAYPKKDGLLLIVRRSKPAPHIYPRRFHFALVVVHTQDVNLSIIPSISNWRRAWTFRRSTIRPIRLDSAVQSGEDLSGCALQEAGGCHPTCDDFGQEHMTMDIWRRFLVNDDINRYDGDVPGNVSPLIIPARGVHPAGMGALRGDRVKKSVPVSQMQRCCCRPPTAE